MSELMSCAKEEVDILGSPSLTVRTVSVDVTQQSNETLRVPESATTQQIIPQQELNDEFTSHRALPSALHWQRDRDIP